MKIKGFIKLLRIPNDIMIGVAVIIGEYISLLSVPHISKLLFGFFSGFLFSATIMILNDYFDVPVDMINNPNRPIVKGDVTKREALYSALILSIIGLSLSLFLSIYAFIIGITFLMLGFLYNYKVKRLGLLGNIIVSLSVSVPYVYGALAVDKSITLLIVILFIMSFLANMSREIIKGIVDIEGDRALGINTLAVTHGPKTASLVASILIILAVIISYIPWIYNMLNIYYLIVVQFANLIFLFGVVKILNDPSKSIAYFVKKLFLYAMAVGLLSFIVGTINI